MMTALPHPDTTRIHLHCAIITVSDTRDLDSDRSGQLIGQYLNHIDHIVDSYQILKDDPELIRSQVEQLSLDPNLAVIILNGGTGIAPRDTTFDAIAGLLEKTLPGFGEIFRFLCYQEIGSRAIASRAVAGVYRNKLIFSLPGSSNAVKLALENLILPELHHLVTQINPDYAKSAQNDEF
jgi:molybdenum cofactor biosynthesis protein B